MNNVESRLDFPKERKVSDELKKLLRCLLEKDPARRIKMK